jgi:RNA polymerase sigma-70 factor (ECF subfamily)
MSVGVGGRAKVRVSRRELDDPRLRRAVQAGDGAAITRVLERCLPSLRRRLAARLGLSADDCEDLLQEVRVAFLAAATRYRGESSLQTFVFEIACHKCSDYLRARRRERGRKTRATATERTSAGDDPVFGQAMDLVAVREAMARLTSREQQVLELYYLDGKSYQEISVAMGIGTGSISSLKAEALLSLRAIMGEEGRGAGAEVSDEQPS